MKSEHETIDQLLICEFTERCQTELYIPLNKVGCLPPARPPPPPQQPRRQVVIPTVKETYPPLPIPTRWDRWSKYPNKLINCWWRQSTDVRSPCKRNVELTLSFLSVFLSLWSQQHLVGSGSPKMRRGPNRRSMISSSSRVRFDMGIGADSSLRT